MLRYYDACWALTRQLAHLIALSLKLEASYFDEVATNLAATLRPLHYTPAISKPDEVRCACCEPGMHACPAAAADLRGPDLQGIFGAGAHTDFGLITILATDEVPGLQVTLPLSPVRAVV